MKRLFQVFLLPIIVSYGYSSLWGCEEKSSKQTLSVLREQLLCDYDPYIRPKLDHKVATNVSVKFILKSFSYDVHSHLLVINAWTTVTWLDDHLKWNPDEYKGIDSTHIETDAIWTPDLSHYNRYQQDGNNDIINDVNCHLTYVGRVFCLSPGKYETLCTADLTKYPYDTQECGLIIGSWVHTGEEVNLDFIESAIYEFIPNPEWDLIKTEYARHTGENPYLPNSTFPMISYFLTMERRGGFLEATAIIPSLGLIAMTLMILLLDAVDSDRVTLIVCNIIAHTIYLHYVSWNVPSFGDKIPKIILFGRDSMVMVFVELILTIILRTLRQNHETASNRTMGLIGKALESRVGNMILVMDFSLKNTVKLNKNDDDGENIIENVQPNNEKDFVLFGKLVDRLCFFTFLIVYFIMIVKFIF